MSKYGGSKVNFSGKRHKHGQRTIHRQGWAEKGKRMLKSYQIGVIFASNNP